jgi:predicted MFS family arabinose efflux permease
VTSAPRLAPGAPGASVAGWPLRLAVLTLAFMATATAEALLGPLLPAMRDDFGIGYRDVGFLGAVLMGATAVGSLAGAPVAARFGPRAGLVLPCVVLATGAVVVALSPGIAVVAVGLAVMGLGIGSYFAPALVQVSRLRPHRRATMVATWSSGFTLGLAVATSVAWVLDGRGWRWAFATVAVIVAVVGGLLGARRWPVTAVPLARGGRLPRGRGFFGAVWISGAAAVGFYGVVLLLPVLLVDDLGFSLGQVTAFVVVVRLCGLPTQIVAGAIADRLGRGTVALAGLLTMATSLVAALLAGDSLWALPCFGVYLASVSTLFPTANTLFLETAPPGGQERAAAVGRAAQIACGGLGALVVGWVAELTSVRVGMALGVVAALSALRAAAGFRRGPSPRTVAPA